MRLRIVFGLTLAVALALTLSLVPFVTSATTANHAPVRIADLEGRLLTDPFLSYFERNGGQAVFGAPLTDALIDAALGVPVQYFAYARFELHNGAVQLTRVGTLRAHGREGEAPFLWQPADAPLPEGRAYVPESGHTLGGAFGWYHQTNGGVGLLGYPISEEFYEGQPDGSSLLVQYFERARLSFHPGADGTPGEVRRDTLGLWMAKTIFPQEYLTPKRPLVPLGNATMTYQPGSNAGRNIELALSRLNGLTLEPGSSLSFLKTIGDVSARAGYMPAEAIVSGEIVGDMVGGGICVVSTLLYRASWSAGLPVEERAGHSLMLGFFADAPGLEAAVYDPGQDLRVRNDTGERIFIGAAARNGVVTLTLWGRGDGRKVDLTRPSLSGGDTIAAINVRVIRSAAGDVRKERAITYYSMPPATVANAPAIDNSAP